MKNILIIVFMVITTSGLVFSWAKYFRVAADSPEIYEVTSSDGTRYTTKKGSFERCSNKFKDSAEVELEDGTTVVLLNNYSYKLLNPDSDEVKRWENAEWDYLLLALGCTVAWVMVLCIPFDM